MSASFGVACGGDAEPSPDECGTGATAAHGGSAGRGGSSGGGPPEGGADSGGAPQAEGGAGSSATGGSSAGDPGSAGTAPNAGGADSGGADSGGADSGGADSGTSGAGGSVEEEPPPDCDEMSQAAFNLAVDGTATASHATASIGQAFDDHTGTKWVASSDSAWIAYEFADASHAVVTYSLTVPGNSPATDDPAAWELQGSDDTASEPEDAEWTTVDTQAGQTFTARYQTNWYSVENTTAYRRYRLLFTENGGGTQLQLAEVALFGEGTPVFSIDDTVRGDGEHQFEFSPGWVGVTIDASTPRYHGSSSWNNYAGEFVTLAFSGTRIQLYGVTDPKHGIAGVTIDDGDERRADFYGTTTEFNRLVYQSPLLCPGPHTLQVRVMGEANPSASDVYVSLDRVVVIP